MIAFKLCSFVYSFRFFVYLLDPLSLVIVKEMPSRELTGQQVGSWQSIVSLPVEIRIYEGLLAIFSGEQVLIPVRDLGGRSLKEGIPEGEDIDVLTRVSFRIGPLRSELPSLPDTRGRPCSSVCVAL